MMRKAKTMSVLIQVPLPDDQVAALQRKAESAGLQVEMYVSHLVAQDLRHARSLSEVLEGFRKQVAESGISDEELDELFVSSRNEVAV